MSFLFRAAVFDLDGTLIDSYAAIHASLNAVLEAFARPSLTADETRRMVGHGLEMLIEKAVGKENVTEGVRVFCARYEDEGPAQTMLLPGADHVTRALTARGVPLAIASNKPSYFSRQLLSALGIAERFRSVVGPDLSFPPKPDPAMVLAALDVLAVRPDETLFVGDMTVDVDTARAARMRIAVLPTGSATREELLASAPDYVFDRLEDVLGLFGT